MAKETSRVFQKGVRDDRVINDLSSDQKKKKNLFQQLLLLQEELEKEKKQGEILDKRTIDQKRKNWWAKPLENLELNQLEELERVCLALDTDITKEIERRINGVPKVVDLPQNATIEYISSGEGETSSSTSTYDYVNFGIDVGSGVQGGGSSMSDGANAAGAFNMKARIDG